MSTQELDVRARLLRLIQEYPGLHVRELARQAQESEQLTLYHLVALESERRVRAQADGALRRYYRAGAPSFSAEERRLMGTLRNPIALRTALLLLAAEPVAHGALAQRLGIAKSTMSYHVQRFVHKGFLVDRGTGLALRDSATVRRLLERWRPPPSLTDRFAALWDAFYAGRAKTRSKAE